MQSLLLSTHGSDRATGYNLSNKLVRRDGVLFTGWLDAPEAPGAPCKVRLGGLDRAGALQKDTSLGEVPDNHCGPALSLDRDNRMHAILGAHGGPFIYRWSDHPEDPSSWSPPEPLGPVDTYPSLAVDAAGTLHLTHRAYGERWQLWYRRKRAGRAWETPVALATSPEPGYNHFMQSLSLGPGGALHLVFQFHYGSDPALTADQKGRLAVHLRSDDGGETWFNEGRRSVLPLTIETAIPFCRYPEGGIRVSNHVIDAEDRLWVFTSIPNQSSGALFRRDAYGWTNIDLGETFGCLDFSGGHGREVSLSRDRQGLIHLVAATVPGGAPGAWFDPRHELFHLVLTEGGRVRSFRQLTDSGPQIANWLPALEQWDWNRAATCETDVPWLLFTRGLNRGGIGGDNANALRTEVHLTRLDTI